MASADCRRLIGFGRGADRFSILALSGVISMAPERNPPYDVPIAGLGRPGFAQMIDTLFPGFPAEDLIVAIPPAQSALDARADEFGDLLEMLLEHRTYDTDECVWLAYAIATASMGGNHLWQDMGLPDRKVLSRLIERNFTSLFVRNVGDMKWKKFFYRQLCIRAEVLICKSPSCGICVDYQACFGPEVAVVPMPLARFAGAPDTA